jgi:hypothetical protein
MGGLLSKYGQYMDIWATESARKMVFLQYKFHEIPKKTTSSEKMGEKSPNSSRFETF